MPHPDKAADDARAEALARVAEEEKASIDRIRAHEARARSKLERETRHAAAAAAADLTHARSRDAARKGRTVRIEEAGQFLSVPLVDGGRELLSRDAAVISVRAHPTGKAICHAEIVGLGRRSFACTADELAAALAGRNPYTDRPEDVERVARAREREQRLGSLSEDDPLLRDLAKAPARPPT
jgi:hypothetical protein